jgi:hypothetical protein
VRHYYARGVGTCTNSSRRVYLADFTSKKQQETTHIERTESEQIEHYRIPTPFSLLAYHGITVESIHTIYSLILVTNAGTR